MNLSIYIATAVIAFVTLAGRTSAADDDMVATEKRKSKYLRLGRSDGGANRDDDNQNIVLDDDALERMLQSIYEPESHYIGQEFPQAQKRKSKYLRLGRSGSGDMEKRKSKYLRLGKRKSKYLRMG